MIVLISNELDPDYFLVELFDNNGKSSSYRLSVASFYELLARENNTFNTTLLKAYGDDKDETDS